MPRPKSHYGAGKKSTELKNSAPQYHTIKPDLLKLARCIEDSLTGILWLDDSQIAKEVLRKIYKDPIGAHISVYPISQPQNGEKTTHFLSIAK